MLHEILLSLLGKTGNIVIESESRFEINPGITFLASCEKDLVNRIVILGFFYRTIERFLRDTYEAFTQTASQVPGSVFEDEGAEFGFGRSLYVKGLSFAINEVLKEYREVVLSIEREYLKNRVYTLSLMNIQLGKFFFLMPELSLLIERIMRGNLKGGQIIDLLNERNSFGNEYLREIYSILIESCYKILYNQMSAWILYGKVADRFGEFFIYKVEKKSQEEKNAIKENNMNTKSTMVFYINKSLFFINIKKQYNWDSSYSIKFSMIPQSIVSIKIAEKILFTGKANKILQNTKKNALEIENSALPDIRIISLLKELETFDNFKFTNIIEKLRFEVGAELLELLVKKEGFLQHLTNIKTYYFLGQGLFYQIFFEEAKPIMQLPPKNTSEGDLNNIALQNTIIRLNWEDNKIFKKLSFKIKSHGFEFNNFANITGLKILGEVKQRKNSFIRFEPMRSSLESGAIWYTLKQNLENGFKASFSFRFKKSAAVSAMPKPGSSSQNQTSLPNNSSNSTQFEERNANTNISMNNNQEFSRNVFAFVLHNAREFADYKKTLPRSLMELPEYVAIKFGLIERQRKKDFLITNDAAKPFVQVVYFSKEKHEKFAGEEMGENNKESVLFEDFFDGDSLNFAEEDVCSARVQYNNETLEVFFGEMGTEIDSVESKSKVKVGLKIGKLLNLEMGKGFVGFLQDSKNGLYGVDLLNWKMLGFNILNNEDSWNGLTVNYQVDWPMSLIISSNVIEKFTNIFRYLFPIRLVQLDLQKVWMNLMKNHRPGRLDKTSRKLINVRNQMSSVIESLWSYFHLDVLEVQWARFNESFNEVADFDEMRRIVDEYLNSISSQLFIHFPKIVKSIFELINNCKTFINLLLRLEYGGSIESLGKDCEEVRVKFEDNFLKLLKLLELLNKNYNSPFLFQLLLRLDYNNFYLDSPHLNL